MVRPFDGARLECVMSASNDTAPMWSFHVGVSLDSKPSIPLPCCTMRYTATGSLCPKIMLSAYPLRDGRELLFNPKIGDNKMKKNVMNAIETLLKLAVLIAVWSMMLLCLLAWLGGDGDSGYSEFWRECKVESVNE